MPFTILVAQFVNFSKVQEKTRMKAHTNSLVDMRFNQPIGSANCLLVQRAESKYLVVFFDS